jgi:hypothetical protein
MRIAHEVGMDLQKSIVVSTASTIVDVTARPFSIAA